MQFHLNGFGDGDPGLASIREAVRKAGDEDPLPTCADVLIVGCGPAGLTLAAQLAAFPSISTCIVDQKPGPLELGQADGIACRTMEMFEALGIVDTVLREAYWVNETTFWKPGAGAGAYIERSGRVLDTEPGLSEFPHVILNQARIHDLLLGRMKRAAAPISPHYGWRLVSLETSRSDDDYPVQVRLESSDPDRQGEVKEVRARYAIGCDGARSKTRAAIGLTLKGESMNQVWGVMDVLAATDFPDIRLKSVINAAERGSLLLIPREGGYLVRVYVELGDLTHGERASTRGLGFDDIVAAAEHVLAPYRFDVREVAWWSIYEIGQRLSDRFDDATGHEPRIFIAGDACHTHSPKAGQGMNVSMQDAFNLGWKLAAVLEGRSPRELLRTYSDERQAVARELIEFDREWAGILSAPLKDPADPDSTGLDPAEVQAHFLRHGRYTAGTATRYRPSPLTASSDFQKLAHGLPIGMRFHSAPVVRAADARPMQLGHAARADGRWRLYAFAGAGDPASAASPVHRLCAFLLADPASPIVRYTPRSGDMDSVIDLRAIFQQPHDALALEGLPALLRPIKGKLGLSDYEKIFCAKPGVDDVYEMRGIDRADGCLIVVRPDQYVADVMPLTAFERLTRFFGGVLSGSEAGSESSSESQTLHHNLT